MSYKLPKRPGDGGLIVNIKLGFNGNMDIEKTARWKGFQHRLDPAFNVISFHCVKIPLPDAERDIVP